MTVIYNFPFRLRVQFAEFKAF